MTSTITTTTTIETMTTTPTIVAPVEGLFGSELVSPEIAASLPAGYTVRALQKSDYEKGFLDCLRVLTTVGDITLEQWNERYDWMSTSGKGAYYLLVITNEADKVVATGALIVERKLYVPSYPLNIPISNITNS
jgi:glucosamine-phosphate N-acetyltransferase